MEIMYKANTQYKTEYNHLLYVCSILQSSQIQNLSASMSLCPNQGKEKITLGVKINEEEESLATTQLTIRTRGRPYD